MAYRYHVEGERSVGWCCVPTSSNSELAGFQRSEERDMTLTFDQPQLVPPPRFEPQEPMRSTQYSRFSTETPRTTRSRSSSLARLSRPWISQSRSRPSISAPMDFRRVTEPLPSARRSFRPLELSIYMPSGRISPLPDFESDEWTRKLPQKPNAALLRRETVDNSELPCEFRRKPLSASSSFNLRRTITSEPFLNVEDGPGLMIRRSTMESEQVLSDLATINEDRTPTLIAGQFEEEIPGLTRPWSSRGSILSSPLRMRSPSPFSNARTRSRTNPESMSRNGSVRKSKNDTIDDAIRELNTIVEQKRVKAIIGARDSTDTAPLSPTSHVPAIAPSMKVRARSETLSDIGSAFSISYTSQPMPVPSPSVASTQRHMSRSPLPALRLATPYSPIQSTNSSSTAIANSSKASVKSRLSTWIKRSLPGSPATPNAPQPFYQLTPPATAHGQKQQQARHTRNSSSLSSDMSNISSMTMSTRDSNSSAYNSATTPATTIAGSLFSPTTPADVEADDASMFPLPRPSMSKTPKTVRRVGQMKRGLSIDTTRSNGSALTTGPPPAYEEKDPASAGLDAGVQIEAVGGPLTPSRVGVAF